MSRGKSIAVAVIVTLVTAVSSFAQGGRLIVRGRGLALLPDDDGEIVSGSNARLAVDSAAGGELSAVYLLTSTWGVELAAAAAPLDLTTKGTPELDAGSVRATLATLSLQYHFATKGRVRPYLSLGATLATFSGYEVSQDLVDLGLASAEFSQSVRLGSQVGADILLGKGWIASVAASYIPVTTRVGLLTPAGATFDTVTLEVNPIVLAFGFGRVF